MINRNSTEFQKVSAVLDNAFATGNCENWKKLLDDMNKSYLDGFLVFLSHNNSKSLLKDLGFNSINDWLSDVENWRYQVCDVRSDSQGSALILYHLWETLSNRLKQLVRESRLRGEIPSSGGVLLYVAGLTKCIILKYHIKTEIPKFEIIDIIDNPKSAFDFWGTITQADMKNQNLLKEILSTGHKIISHRGVLIHVDRRHDVEVFGPSIDTILLSEILAQDVYESEGSHIQKALEIGCGNGLLTISIAKHCRNLEELHSIDINFNAITCANRNLVANIHPHLLIKKKVYFTSGSFEPELFASRFDLIVCNPPYIPLPTAKKKDGKSQGKFFQAVGGLELLDCTLQSLDRILKPNGRLLLLVSNLSLKFALSRIPKLYTYYSPIKDGFEVLFDVESVLNKPSWLDYLKTDCGLISRKKLFYHKLFPMWIQNSERA